MKKSIVISMALFAFAFTAGAGVVTIDRAGKVARGWLVREGKAPGRQSVAVERSSVLRLQGLGDEAKYYAVKFQGGGTVVTSSDDTASPVVVFSDKDEELNVSDVNSPLYALLRRDFLYRRDAGNAAARFARESAMVSTEYRFYVNHQRMLERNRQEWSRLAGDDGFDALSALKGSLAWYGKDDWFIPTYTANSLYDVRVAPFVKSRWSQSDVRGMACYNYYTPNEDNPYDQYGNAGRADNAVCGCVATALAQVLRYFAFDKEVTRTNEAFLCTYTMKSGAETTIVRNLQGGRYNWDAMTLVPELGTQTGGFTATNAMEIGKLCADCGTAVRMMYSRDSSGAYSSDAYDAITSVFGYSGARWFGASGQLGTSSDGSVVSPEDFPDTRSNALQRVFYSNFDAGLPVLVGLTGHEVVADGYGYSQDGLDYVHINMGWGGQCDLWYLLPNVSCDSNGRPEGNLMFFDDCAYNIFTTNATSDVVMSGRVVNDDGDPIAGASVRICRPGDHDNPVAEFVTGENGIWGLVIAPGTYEVVAADDLVTDSETYTFSDNRWGCDVTLAPVSVRNLMQPAPDNEYASLDKAILSAGTNDVLEVFGVTRLKRSHVLDRDLTIKVADLFADDPTNCLIRCSGAAMLTVAPGVRAEFRGLAFRSDAETVISVEPDGVAAFAGKLGVGTVRTADENGFELAGAIDFIAETGFCVDCAQARAAGERFGRWTCSESEKDSAMYVLNPHDLDLGGVAGDDGSVVWGVVPVDPRNAAARVGDDYYRTLDNLFRQRPEGDLDVVLLKDVDSFDTRLELVGRKVSITSEGGRFTVSGCSMNVGFVVGAGGELTFSNVVFDGFSGEWFVRIPEDGGVFTLGENAWLHGFRVTGSPDPGSMPNGIVSMTGGKMFMKPGSLISDCSYANGTGSTVSLYGGKLDIDGGAIIGCSAEKDGGAICYCPYYDGAELRLSGNVDICGNVVNGGGSMIPGDVYLGSAAARVIVGDGLDSVNGIGICGWLEGLGKVFGTVSGSIAGPEVFFNDANVRLEKPLAAVLNGDRLLWDYAADNKGECDPSEATVLVTGAGSAGTKYYPDLVTALDNLSGDATIVLSQDQYLSEDAVIGLKVTIDGAGFRIIREAPCSVVVTSKGDLTLKNVLVAGYDYERPWSYHPYYYDMFLMAEFRGSNRRIIYADGGRIALGDGAEIAYLGIDQAMDALFDPAYEPSLMELLAAYYPWPEPHASDTYDRASCAVVVDNGGTFVMEPGSSIHDCWNLYDEDPVSLGVTAGVLIEDSTAVLRGGSIYGCVAVLGSAFDVCQEGVVYLDGDVDVLGNVDVNGDRSDFVLEDLSKLYVRKPFAGGMGFAPGYFADTNRVSEVITSLTEAEVAASATHFLNTKTGARAVGVKCSKGYLIVWSTAITGGNKYREVADDGTVTVWTLIGNELPKSVASFRLADEVSYDAKIHGAVSVSIGCEISGVSCATNAGDYVCSVTPAEGYAWEDGSDGAVVVPWKIYPAPLVICPKSGVKRFFIMPEDQIADNEPRPFAFTAERFYGSDSVENTLTGEISHVYFGQNVWANSYYTIGTLECTNSNYYIDIANFNPGNCYVYIDNSKTNDFSIVGPDYIVITNVPTEIAFTSIVRSEADQSCTVTISDLVKNANYSVYTATTLDDGFDIGTVAPFTNFNAEADGPITISVQSATPALFWRAAGRTTYITNYLNGTSSK